MSKVTVVTTYPDAIIDRYIEAGERGIPFILKIGFNSGDERIKLTQVTIDYVNKQALDMKGNVISLDTPWKSFAFDEVEGIAGDEVLVVSEREDEDTIMATVLSVVDKVMEMATVAYSRITSADEVAPISDGEEPTDDMSNDSQDSSFAEEVYVEEQEETPTVGVQEETAFAYEKNSPKNRMFPPDLEEATKRMEEAEELAHDYVSHTLEEQEQFGNNTEMLQEMYKAQGFNSDGYPVHQEISEDERKVLRQQNNAAIQGEVSEASTQEDNQVGVLGEVKDLETATAFISAGLGMRDATGGLKKPNLDGFEKAMESESTSTEWQESEAPISESDESVNEFVEGMLSEQAVNTGSYSEAPQPSVEVDVYTDTSSTGEMKVTQVKERSIIEEEGNGGSEQIPTTEHVLSGEDDGNVGYDADGSVGGSIKDEDGGSVERGSGRVGVGGEGPEYNSGTDQTGSSEDGIEVSTGKSGNDDNTDNAEEEKERPRVNIKRGTSFFTERYPELSPYDISSKLIPALQEKYFEKIAETFEWAEDVSKEKLIAINNQMKKQQLALIQKLQAERAKKMEEIQKKAGEAGVRPDFSDVGHRASCRTTTASGRINDETPIKENKEVKMEAPIKEELPKQDKSKLVSEEQTVKEGLKETPIVEDMQTEQPAEEEVSAEEYLNKEQVQDEEEVPTYEEVDETPIEDEITFAGEEYSENEEGTDELPLDEYEESQRLERASSNSIDEGSSLDSDSNSSCDSVPIVDTFNITDFDPIFEEFITSLEWNTVQFKEEKLNKTELRQQFDAVVYMLKSAKELNQSVVSLMIGFDDLEPFSYGQFRTVWGNGIEWNEGRPIDAFHNDTTLHCVYPGYPVLLKVGIGFHKGATNGYQPLITRYCNDDLQTNYVSMDVWNYVKIAQNILGLIVKLL